MTKTTIFNDDYNMILKLMLNTDEHLKRFFKSFVSKLPPHIKTEIRGSCDACEEGHFTTEEGVTASIKLNENEIGNLNFEVVDSNKKLSLNIKPLLGANSVQKFDTAKQAFTMASLPNGLITISTPTADRYYMFYVAAAEEKFYLIKRYYAVPKTDEVKDQYNDSINEIDAKAFALLADFNTIT